MAQPWGNLFAPTKVQTADGRRALGRLPPGTMNKMEHAYSVHLEYERIHERVLWWKFEGVKLRLAPATFLTVDFAVMVASGMLEMHETKGFMEEDALVKLKVAASMYPFRFLLVKRQSKSAGNGWTWSEI